MQFIRSFVCPLWREARSLSPKPVKLVHRRVPRGDIGRGVFFFEYVAKWQDYSDNNFQESEQKRESAKVAWTINIGKEYVLRTHFSNFCLK